MSSDAPKDGGPAFPLTVKYLDGSGRMMPGMSLRDWFAGQAISGLVMRAQPDELQQVMNGTRVPNLLANGAYAIADALLASREAKP